MRFEKLQGIDNKLQELATLRWEVETSGYVWNSFPVHSDDRAQFKALAEVQNIQAGFRVSGSLWKFKDNIFRSVSNQDFLFMFQAGAAHINKCFYCESLCQELIRAGSLDSVKRIWKTEWDKL